MNSRWGERFLRRRENIGEETKRLGDRKSYLRKVLLSEERESECHRDSIRAIPEEREIGKGSFSSAVSRISRGGLSSVLWTWWGLGGELKPRTIPWRVSGREIFPRAFQSSPTSDKDTSSRRGKREGERSDRLGTVGNDSKAF